MSSDSILHSTLTDTSIITTQKKSHSHLPYREHRVPIPAGKTVLAKAIAKHFFRGLDRRRGEAASFVPPYYDTLLVLRNFLDTALRGRVKTLSDSLLVVQTGKVKFMESLFAKPEHLLTLVIATAPPDHGPK